MRHAVILAGGGGTRLWPASRRSRPKQFLALGASDDETLLGATARRMERVSGVSTSVVTAADQAERVAATLPELPTDRIFAEPAARNTAAAIGLAAVHLAARDPEAVLGISPADHHVADEKAFASTVDAAFRLAETTNTIVTVGIRPTRPDTGFGYLELGEPTAASSRQVVRFVEKPDRPTAERYLASGNFLWNSGMFFFRASRILEDLARCMPETRVALDRIAKAIPSGTAAQVAASVYPTLPSISIDYGVMEKTGDILALPGDFGWNDVGAWSALHEIRQASADPAGNVGPSSQGDGPALVAVDASGNLAVADPGTVVALVGVSDLVVVQSGNAVLVMPRDRAQDVKEVVRLLEERRLQTYL